MIWRSPREVLEKAEAQLSLDIARQEIAFRALRSDLVERYGEDGVLKVEARIEREAKSAGQK